MKNITIFIVSLFISISIFCQSNQGMEEDLIVFSQKEDIHFLENTLPKIKLYCQEKGIELIQKDAVLGTPENIASTPAIVYQNYKGRSVYSSRYSEFSTITNFIRTARVVPQKGELSCRENLLVWQNGRTKIASSVKITSLQGKKPKAFSEGEFQTKVTNALETGMTNFERQKEVCLNKTDRLFYLDIHPYLSKEGQLFLTFEMYSKFSCKTPIFSKLSDPIVGEFEDSESLFNELGRVFQEEIINQMQTSVIGDAFTSIKKTVPIRSWEELNLELPEAPKEATDLVNFDLELPKNWTFKSGIDSETPIVQFRFMEPLDRYVGEIRQIKGELKLSDNQLVESGLFVAEMQSLTMGMEDFDKNVLTKYIKAFKFPKSSFQFRNTKNNESLEWGETLFLKVEGTFELMKKENPVLVSAQITPIIGTEGEALLKISASFSLNVVDDFGIKGPDGPSPARKMMLFDLNFLMKKRKDNL